MDTPTLALLPHDEEANGTHEDTEDVGCSFGDVPEERKGTTTGTSIHVLTTSGTAVSLARCSLKILHRTKYDLVLASYVDTTTGYGHSAQSLTIALQATNFSIRFMPIGASWRPSLWESSLKPQVHLSRQLKSFSLIPSPPLTKVISMISNTGGPTVFIGYHVPHEYEVVTPTCPSYHWN